MSDNNSKKGFGSPENRKNINRGGRPKGSKNKATVMSDDEFAEAIMSHDQEIIRRIMKIIRNGTDAAALKAAGMMMGWSIKLREDSLIISRKDEETGEEKSYEVKENPEGSGATVSYISTKMSS